MKRYKDLINTTFDECKNKELRENVENEN